MQLWKSPLSGSRQLTLILLLITICNSVIQAQSSGATKSADEMVTLNLTNTLKGSLAQGQIARYYVKLEANYFTLINVNLRGVDGVVSLYSPDGLKLQSVEQPHGSESLKQMWWINDTAGRYRVDILATDSKSVGTYQISIIRCVENNEQNQNLINAERLEAEGWRLHEIGTEEALREAIPKLQKAVALWREVVANWPDKSKVWETSMYLGEVYYNLSEYRNAIEVYEPLEPLLIPSDAIDATWTYNNLATSFSGLGEIEKARAYYERALEATHERDAFLKRTRGMPQDPRSFAIAFTALGNINLQLGQKQKALDFFNQSIPYWNVARHGKPEAFGLARNDRGLSQFYASIGDQDRAISYADQALQYSRETADLIGQVEALNILGVINSASGNYVQAATNFTEGLRVAVASGDRNGQGKALTNLGFVYLNLNQLTEAQASFTRALEIFHDIENRGGEARALTGTGMLARAKHDRSRALQSYEQALPLRRATKDREGEAETLYEMAQLHVESNEYRTARAEIEKAIEQIEYVRSGFSGADIRASYQSTVQRYYEFYIGLLMLMHKYDPTARFDELAYEKSELARARSLLESLREAGLNIREGNDSKLIARERELQRSLQDKGESWTRRLNTRFTPEREAEAERELTMVLDEYSRVQAMIREGSPHYAALTQPRALSVAQVRSQVLDADSVLLSYELGEERSFLWLVSRELFMSFELPGRAQIHSLAREFQKQISLRPSQQQPVSVDPKLQESEKTNEAAPAGPALAKMILAPALPYLKKKRLLIVPDDALHYIPFAALPLAVAGADDCPPTPARKRLGAGERAGHEPQCPLILKHEIIMLPSASTLAVLRAETAHRSLPPNRIAIFADPVFSKNDRRVRQTGSKPFEEETPHVETRTLQQIALQRALQDFDVREGRAIPRLRATRWEAQAIAGLAPRQSWVSLDFAASKPTVLNSNLDRYRIVHFATHALVNSRHPELSGILLSLVDERGQRRDGFLQAHEVYNLRVPAELLVLSACDTALGKEIKGEGLISITRGFMYAGARRVASTLWQVDSEATAELMTRFYDEMLKHKLPPAAALRAAQVSMWEEGRSPYYWASFVIQGEYH